MSMTIQEFERRTSGAESFLIANDGQFLGKLTLNKYDIESIANNNGNYGNPYSNISIYNEYGNYGSAYSSLSPFNLYTATPPRIFLNGVFYGYLTKNKYLSQILDPNNLVNWMRSNGLNY